MSVFRVPTSLLFTVAQSPNVGDCIPLVLFQ